MEQYVEFVTNHPALFALLGVVIAAIVWTELRRLTKGYREIGPMEAVQLINHEDAMMLDVREDTEVAQGKIQNSRHIPLSVLRQRVDELKGYRDKPVVVYCRSGNRSGTAGDILLKNDFKNVYNLKGGILAWENANLPKVRK